VTEYASVDVADMSFNSTFELSGGIGSNRTTSTENREGDDGGYELATRSTELTPGLNAKETLSKSEAQKVRYRYMALNGTLDKKKLQIEQEGMREIDLAGNVIANVSLQFDVDRETVFIASHLKRGDSSIDISNIKLTKAEALVPDLGAFDDIKATLDFKYTYRHVRNGKGQRTFFEWDDKVIYYSDSISKDITLFARRDVLPPFYYIGNASSGSIKFEDKVGGDGKLVFQDYQSALEFLEWLCDYSQSSNDKDKPIVIDNIKLYFSEANQDSVLIPSKVSALKGALVPCRLFN
jgi:hypothetical protein